MRLARVKDNCHGKAQQDEVLLKVTDLCINFKSEEGTLRAVDGLNFEVRKGETLAIVGESGCGKSVMSMSILRLLPRQTSEVTGAVEFEGTNVLSLSEKRMRSIRGNEISMVFQEPATSLNPVLTVGYQLRETIRLHTDLRGKAADKRGEELLALVGIPAPAQRLKEYPHQMSGGMKQRVMIAIALAAHPKLLIADEPTTALDVTIQAQILDLMSGLKKKIGSSVILITHDLGVVAQMADRVIVMYAGRKVEEATVGQLFEMPMHPYTVGLLNAVPKLGSSLDSTAKSSLVGIDGYVPDLRKPIIGCVFESRCQFATDRCRSEEPTLTDRSGHLVACHYLVNEIVT